MLVLYPVQPVEALTILGQRQPNEDEEKGQMDLHGQFTAEQAGGEVKADLGYGTEASWLKPIGSF